MDGKPQCSLSIAPLSQCDFGIFAGEGRYYKGRMAYTVLHDYLHIVGVPSCIEKYVDASYWEFYHAHNSAWTLSTALAIAAAGLVLLI